MSYYDYSGIDGYNKLINIICGGRDIGKTFGAKLKAISHFQKTGYMSIFLVRYGNEITDFPDAFKRYFADVNRVAYPDKVIEVRGKAAYFDNKQFATFYPLARAQKAKYISWYDFDRIFFDEYIAKDLRYLKDEADAFLDFYDTVDRMRGTTKAYLLSNAITVSNPYFKAFGLAPDLTRAGYYFPPDNKRSIVLHYVPPDEDLGDRSKAAAFVDTIKGTKYGDYSLGNTFLLDSAEGVGTPSESMSHLFNIIYNDDRFSVWSAPASETIWVRSRFIPSKYNYNLSRTDYSLTAHNGRGAPLEIVEQAYRTARLRFDSVDTKNRFIDLLKF